MTKRNIRNKIRKYIYKFKKYVYMYEIYIFICVIIFMCIRIRVVNTSYILSKVNLYYI